MFDFLAGCARSPISLRHTAMFYLPSGMPLYQINSSWR